MARKKQMLTPQPRLLTVADAEAYARLRRAMLVDTPDEVHLLLALRTVEQQ